MKIADRYLDVEPWGLTERGFHADRSRVSESLFALANGLFGTRGHFDETYSGDTLVGTYCNGVYDELVGERSGYRGISNRVCFTTNSVNWLFTRITIGGEELDLANAAYVDFVRSLDFRTGLLTRAFTWNTKGGAVARLTFERLVSMDERSHGSQRITIELLSGRADVTVESGIDFSAPHEVYNRSFWKDPERGAVGDTEYLAGETVGTRRGLVAAYRTTVVSPHSGQAALACAGSTDGSGGMGTAQEPKRASRTHRETLAAGEKLVIEKNVGLVPAGARASGGPVASNASGAAPVATARADGPVAATASAAARDEAIAAAHRDFTGTLASNSRYWAEVWERSDIAIEGDPENQQGVRFCIFQLEQTYSGGVADANIGAKGLTGEFYNGNAFWDTEVYCLPYYLFGNTEAARKLLSFRHRTLPQAIERARELDCEGACYPIATIDGTESCTLWQHASLQFQPTTAVSYAVRHYERLTGDTGFMLAEGIEMLVATARFLASRCGFSERRQRYGFYAVMGPDEFQMMVNHNAYTNYMAKRSLEYTVETIVAYRERFPQQVDALLARLSVRPDEIERWSAIADRMYVPRDEKSLVYEQHEGFFDLPHVDVDAIPVEEFPLYSHWSYDRIYRNDMIKQPDVLMFMFLYNRSFTVDEKRANYDYYEPRCIHESSLSPSVHSILATELGRHDEALELFRFATRIDLDNYNRNTNEGLHMTAIAGAWMNIVYGFGGLRSDGDVLSLAPVLPRGWTRYSFTLTIRGSRVRVSMDGGATSVTLLSGPAVRLVVGGREVEIDATTPFRAEGAPVGA